MTMREKMARALHNRDPKYNWEWEAYSHAPEYYQRRLDDADAILDVLMEPDEGMLAAASLAHHGLSEGDPDYTLILQAMLQHIKEQR